MEAISQSIGLTFDDWMIIAVYFAFVLGIGIYLRRYMKTEDDFFLAGRSSSGDLVGRDHNGRRVRLFYKK